MNTQRTNIIQPRKYVENTYEVHSALFGLLQWKRLIKQTEIGEELYIVTERTPPKVLVNGVEYLPHHE